MEGDGGIHPFFSEIPPIFVKDRIFFKDRGQSPLQIPDIENPSRTAVTNVAALGMFHVSAVARLCRATADTWNIPSAATFVNGCP